MSKFLQALSFVAVLGLLSATASADLLIDLPFNDGTNPTLANYGTLGGAATVYTGSPTTSTNSKTGLGPYSENLVNGSHSTYRFGGSSGFHTSAEYERQWRDDIRGGVRLFGQLYRMEI